MQKGVEAGAGRVEATSSRKRSLKSAFLFAAKLAITLSCFWYLSTKIEWAEVGKLAAELDPRWAALATFLLLPQIVLIGLRWRWIIEALDMSGRPCPFGPPIAISAIAVFFQQALPNLAAEGIRVVLLVRRGWNWQIGLTSVLIDRCVGVLALLTVSFVALLFPSALTALGGNRGSALAMLGLMLASIFVVLLVVPYVAPLLQGWRPTRLLADLASAAHRVLFLSRQGPVILASAFAIHLLTIASVWSLGQAEGLALSVVDAAALFAVITGVTLIPVSVGGWGLRELAVTALLQNYGIAFEKALLFSVSFGLVTIVASLPGAVVWAFYSGPPADHSR